MDLRNTLHPVLHQHAETNCITSTAQQVNNPYLFIVDRDGNGGTAFADRP
jgi:hypothetical protein